jgi:hypothetical protein
LWVGVGYEPVCFPIGLEFSNTSLMGHWLDEFLLAIQIKVHRIQKPQNCNLMCAFQFPFDGTIQKAHLMTINQAQGPMGIFLVGGLGVYYPTPMGPWPGEFPLAI